MIIKLIKNPNSNSIEATWIEEEIKTISIIVEKEIDGEIQRVKEDKDITVETIIHCQSFADSQIALLRQIAKDFNTSLSQEHEEIIADVIANIVLPTKEELDAIVIENEKQRVLSIKDEAGLIIELRYPIFKQLNITNLLDGYTSEDKTKMIVFINAIRAISNEAEINGTALEDIEWGI